MKKKMKIISYHIYYVVPIFLSFMVWYAISLYNVEDDPIVTVKEGKLRGLAGNLVDGSRYYMFKGIPYAAPPVGNLRFKLSDLKGANHGDDIFYLFYNELNAKLYENQLKLREIIYKVTKLWTDFAKTGNPNPDNEVGENWKPYTIHGKKYYNIDDTFSARHYADRERIQFWDEIYAEARLPHISAHRRN